MIGKNQKVLLLAGTREARQIADFCAAQTIDCVATLAGATRVPAPLPVPTISGGFGDAQGFRTFLSDHAITHIVDATHPFADRITSRAFAIATMIGMPHLRLERPAWIPGGQDTWINIADESDAALHVDTNATVFLATGRQTLHRFGNLSHCRQLICRQIDPPEKPFPFANGYYLVGRPPFSIKDEIDIFSRLGVNVLIVKNAGGDASRSKLEAAAKLCIKVIMIARPPPCGVQTVQSTKEVTHWLTTLHP